MSAFYLIKNSKSKALSQLINLAGSELQMQSAATASRQSISAYFQSGEVQEEEFANGRFPFTNGKGRSIFAFYDNYGRSGYVYDRVCCTNSPLQYYIQKDNGEVESIDEHAQRVIYEDLQPNGFVDSQTRAVIRKLFSNSRPPLLW